MVVNDAGAFQAWEMLCGNLHADKRATFTAQRIIEPRMVQTMHRRRASFFYLTLLTRFVHRLVTMSKVAAGIDESAFVTFALLFAIAVQIAEKAFF